MYIHLSENIIFVVVVMPLAANITWHKHTSPEKDTRLNPIGLDICEISKIPCFEQIGVKSVIMEHQLRNFSC